MKKSICFLGMLSLLFLTFSCVNNDDTSTSVVSEEAKITKFYLHSDSIKDIDDYVFTIDHDSMLIYNRDSIAYGTRIDSLSFVLNPRFSSVYINDTLDYYKLNDVYLDFTDSVKFTVVAADKKTSAAYWVQVNVHQVDPDTFVWKGVNSEVFEGDALSAKAIFFGGKLIYMAVVNNRLLAYESEQSARDRAIVNLMVRTGLRCVEVARANVGDVTFIGCDNVRVLMVQGKGRDEKDNYVVLTAAAWKPIREYLDTRKGAKDTDPLFVCESNHATTDGRLTTRTISAIAKRGLRGVGLDNKAFTAHSLRHTAGTNILRAGGSLEQAQMMLRHASPSTTEIYSRMALNERRLTQGGEGLLDRLYNFN